MRRFILIIAICTGVLWGGPVGSGETDDAIYHRAVEAHNRRDYAEALGGFRALADKRYAAAQHNLGLMSSFGRGVPQDYIRALMWFSLAAVQGYDVARKMRDSVIKLLTPAQIAEAQRLAAEWRPKK